MFDIGWTELLVIAVLTVMIVGPKELPRVVRSVTGMIRKIRMMTGEFQSSFDEMAREADLDDIKKKMMETSNRDIGQEIEKTLDPTGDIKNSLDDMKTGLEKDKNTINKANQDSLKQVSQQSNAFNDISKATKTKTSPAKKGAKPVAKKAGAKPVAKKAGSAKAAMKKQSQNNIRGKAVTKKRTSKDEPNA